MGGRTAKVESGSRRPVAGKAGDRPEEKKLIERHRALKDVAARQIEGPLQIQGRQDLASKDRTFEIRRYSLSRSKQRSAKESRNWSQVAPRSL